MPNPLPSHHAAGQEIPPVNLSSVQRVLLVDPIFYVHSIVHYRSALDSTGYAAARFTIVTTVENQTEAKRLTEFCRSQPRIDLRMETRRRPVMTRLHCWIHTARVMRDVEEILKRESYHLVTYLLVDFVLPFVALPILRSRFPRHFSAGIRGIAFRNHGLRTSAKVSLKARLSERLDLFILRRAIRGGAVRKLAFLDHASADRAVALFGKEACGYGVDPVEILPRDGAMARRKLGLSPDVFVALMFGAISARKGVLETLEILRRAELPRPLHIVIAGPVNPALRDALETAVRETNPIHPVTLHDCFVSDEDLPDYFAAADCVICAYKDFAASSGVLLHAASFGKLALVSPGGVMEDAIARHGFGEVVRLEDPAGFIASLRRLMTLATDERARLSEGAINYARSMDARRYMSQFL